MSQVNEKKTGKQATELTDEQQFNLAIEKLEAAIAAKNAAKTAAVEAIDVATTAVINDFCSGRVQRFQRLYDTTHNFDKKLAASVVEYWQVMLNVKFVHATKADKWYLLDPERRAIKENCDTIRKKLAAAPFSTWYSLQETAKKTKKEKKLVGPAEWAEKVQNGLRESGYLDMEYRTYQGSIVHKIYELLDMLVNPSQYI